MNYAWWSYQLRKSGKLVLKYYQDLVAAEELETSKEDLNATIIVPSSPENKEGGKSEIQNKKDSAV